MKSCSQAFEAESRSLCDGNNQKRASDKTELSPPARLLPDHGLSSSLVDLSAAELLYLKKAVTCILNDVCSETHTHTHTHTHTPKAIFFTVEI